MEQIAPADLWVQQVEWPVTFEWTDTDLSMGLIDLGAGTHGPATIVSAERGLVVFFTDGRLQEIEVDGWAPAVFPFEARKQWSGRAEAPARATVASRLQRSHTGEAYLQLSTQHVVTTSPVEPTDGGDAPRCRVTLDFDAEDRLAGLRFDDSKTLPAEMLTKLDEAARTQLPAWWRELRLPVSDLADLDVVES